MAKTTSGGRRPRKPCSASRKKRATRSGGLRNAPQPHAPSTSRSQSGPSAATTASSCCSLLAHRFSYARVAVQSPRSRTRGAAIDTTSTRNDACPSSAQPSLSGARNTSTSRVYIASCGSSGKSSAQRRTAAYSDDRRHRLSSCALAPDRNPPPGTRSLAMLSTHTRPHPRSDRSRAAASNVSARTTSTARCARIATDSGAGSCPITRVARMPAATARARSSGCSGHRRAPLSRRPTSWRVSSPMRRRRSREEVIAQRATECRQAQSGGRLSVRQHLRMCRSRLAAHAVARIDDLARLEEQVHLLDGARVAPWLLVGVKVAVGRRVGARGRRRAKAEADGDRALDDGARDLVDAKDGLVELTHVVAEEDGVDRARLAVGA
eukprot:Unigene346_Nuclearia_a/m.1200 Unigene346_Nuclearia_a/g.1200  ORF Unigene346_Nuclearia_a/g.1200 Unigene346_Nuclearia_a/m.1200 type:complete len:380 (-) Unigene346_Nuclearia_a:1637-2776(-)